MTNFYLQSLDVNNNKPVFGEWLKENRKRLYLSLQELALKAGVSKQYLSVLERGEPHDLTNKPVKPSLEKVDALAKALDVDINEARQVAGYAPIETPNFSPEMMAMMKNISLKVDDADRDELINDLTYAFEIALKRLEERKKRAANKEQAE